MEDHPVAGSRPPVRRRFPDLGRTMRRRVLPSQSFQLLGFTALAVLFGAGHLVWPHWVPLSSATVLILLGGFFLRVRALVLLYLVVASVLVYLVVRTAPVPGGVLVVIGATAALVLLFASSRERLGVQGTLGESMLVDLRDRLQAQGRIPSLPDQWDLETVLKPAYGDAFSGDFLVASRSTERNLLELVLVDVSGKGQAAGTRSLLLSGAFGGLLGAMEVDDFLPAANTYLLRQGWDEGFATAVYVSVDLVTGSYRVASAGHPPSAHFHAGSGRWEVLEGRHGPALGIVPDVAFPAHHGVLRRGDALLAYTDGLVETPGRDLALGIDRLMGQAERLVGRGSFRGGAERIVDGTRTGESDDRALFLLWRH